MRRLQAVFGALGFRVLVHHDKDHAEILDITAECTLAPPSFISSLLKNHNDHTSYRLGCRFLGDVSDGRRNPVHYNLFFS